jgi:hypothetical protein
MTSAAPAAWVAPPTVQGLLGCTTSHCRCTNALASSGTSIRVNSPSCETYSCWVKKLGER